ncbi:MAG: polysaccharide biosynthesis/export family protein [Burkholderiaceae bacterium]
MITSTSLAFFQKLRRGIYIFATIGAALALSACSMAPGMYMGTPQDVSATLKNGTAPPGALTPITAELIKQQSSQVAPISQEVRDLFGTGGSYQIGPGDILNIVIWEHPELTMTPASSNLSTGSTSQADVGNGYNVSTEGFIQFPFLGSIKVAGLTEDQARSLITRRIGAYVTAPQVTVRIQSYRHGRVYMDGEVRTPGLQTMNDISLTLPEALNRAGGFTIDADRSSIMLTRKNVTTRINLPQLTRDGINPQSILLENGDLLRVANRNDSRVYLLGEVLRTNSQVMRDGQLTLGDALGEAGGVTPETSNPRQIYVIRKGNQGHAEIFHLDAASPVSYVLAAGFELKSHDIVFVDPAPIVRWNRVISMLLPSYGAVFTGATITKSAR